MPERGLHQDFPQMCELFDTKNLTQPLNNGGRGTFWRNRLLMPIRHSHDFGEGKNHFIEPTGTIGMIDRHVDEVRVRANDLKRGLKLPKRRVDRLREPQRTISTKPVEIRRVSKCLLCRSTPQECHKRLIS